VAPLVGEIAKAFEARHPGVRIDVQSGGSSRGIADVRRGTADIGMVSRAPKPEEADLVAHAIALDGICLIVHADNPMTALTADQVRGIYTGRLGSWRELGGSDGPITVVNKAEGRSTLELFLAHFQLQAADIRPNVVIGDNLHGILTVAGDPRAIGYVSIGTAERELAQGRTIRLVALGDAIPSTASVRAGNYPLSRPLHLVTGPSPSPLATAFIAFARSAEVDPLVEAQYFVPLAR
jgi:phosphate transport system substrate-binding protein